MHLHVEGLRGAHAKYTWRAAAGEAVRHVARQTNEGLPGHFDGSALFRDVGEVSTDPYVGFVALVTQILWNSSGLLGTPDRKERSSSTRLASDD